MFSSVFSILHISHPNPVTRPPGALAHATSSGRSASSTSQPVPQGWQRRRLARVYFIIRRLTLPRTSPTQASGQNGGSIHPTFARKTPIERIQSIKRMTLKGNEFHKGMCRMHSTDCGQLCVILDKKDAIVLRVSAF